MVLTKGRLEKTAVELFEKSGYGIDPLKNKGRQLVFKDTKKDTLLERSIDYYEVMDLGIGKCNFIVGGLKGKNPFEKVGHIQHIFSKRVLIRF